MLNGYTVSLLFLLGCIIRQVRNYMGSDMTCSHKFLSSVVS
jgi:hypothetical protein